MKFVPLYTCNFSFNSIPVVRTEIYTIEIACTKKILIFVTELNTTYPPYG